MVDCTMAVEGTQSVIRREIVTEQFRSWGNGRFDLFLQGEFLTIRNNNGLNLAATLIESHYDCLLRPLVPPVTVHPFVPAADERFIYFDNTFKTFAPALQTVADSISLIVAEFLKGRPVRPIIRTNPNRHELCNLVRQFLYHNRTVPSEILDALRKYDENGDFIRVNDNSTIRQEITD